MVENVDIAIALIVIAIGFLAAALIVHCIDS